MRAFLEDAKTLYHLTLAPGGGRTHKDRLERFYQSQSESYDEFRKKLLHGRSELVEKLNFKPGLHWVDLGGGTASNLELLPEPVLRSLSRVTVVDLSPSLLEQARQRVSKKGWDHVDCIEADVCEFLPTIKADIVTFSYSLTMIPDWFQALAQASKMLKPGGQLGVVDFYVQRKWARGPGRHNWFQRTLWPTWFGFDNVFLNPDHLPYLRSHFRESYVREGLGKVPYLMLKAPYYVFVGEK